MSSPSMDTIRKALVSVTLEQAIVEIGGGKLLNDVFSALHKKFQCYLPDCYEHPEYLKGVAMEIDEGVYAMLMHSVQEKLAEFSYQKPIEEFLLNISGMKCEAR